MFRSLLAVALAGCVALAFKAAVFDGFVLAPSRPDFFVYKLLGMSLDMSLVNFEISRQFFTHLKVSFSLGFIAAFPYICFEIWRFIAPALYAREKKALRSVFFWASLLFYAGIAVGYFLILPITLNFFISYKVSEAVLNTISLSSYISLLTSTLLAFGLVFEFPAAITVLSRLGLVSREFLRKYRRHAIVVILIIAALITPADPFSMLVAAAPLLLLYEASVLLAARRGETEAREEPQL